MTPETRNYLGELTKYKNEDKTSENVHHLEITELVLLQYNVANNDC